MSHPAPLHALPHHRPPQAAASGGPWAVLSRDRSCACGAVTIASPRTAVATAATRPALALVSVDGAAAVGARLAAASGATEGAATPAVVKAGTGVKARRTAKARPVTSAAPVALQEVELVDTPRSAGGASLSPVSADGGARSSTSDSDSESDAGETSGLLGRDRGHGSKHSVVAALASELEADTSIDGEGKMTINLEEAKRCVSVVRGGAVCVTSDPRGCGRGSCAAAGATKTLSCRLQWPSKRRSYGMSTR